MLRKLSFYDFQFEDEIEIAAPPEAGWAFFEAMEANYTGWHTDHLKFEWREGRGLKVGTVFYFEERIACKLHKKLVRIIEVVPNRLFVFTPVNPLFRFFLPHLHFSFEPTPSGFRFGAVIRLHGIGPLGRRLNRREFDAVERHMAEEVRNLKAILEGGGR